MKRIRRPILINRTLRYRTQNPAPANKKSSPLVLLYQDISTKISTLNQICNSLLFSNGKTSIDPTSIKGQIIESINNVTNAFLFEIQDKSTQETDKLRNLLIKANSDKKLQKTISQIITIYISFIHLRPSLEIVLSSSSNINNHTIFDKIHNLSNESKNFPLPSLYRSADSSMDDLTICSSSPTDSNLLLNLEDEENLTVMCRICEKLIPLDLIEKHSTLCIQAHQTKYQIIKSTDKLKSFNKKLSNQLAVELPGEAKESTSVLYPLLYLYLTIESAINIKGEEPCALSTLESAHHGLNSVQIPKTAIQYAGLFDHGSNLIQKKLNAIQEIIVKTRQIAQTTVDHCVGDLYKEANLSDFEFLTRLSVGAFARVYLAKKISTGDLYAIKVIKKTIANLKNQLRTVTAERDIMMQLHSPYMVNFYYSFIKKNNLYLVMEYLPGGDIYSLLQALGSLPEESVRVYIVQVVKALQFLRENQIIHRDLKPDNLLVDSSGFLRLTDFGLSLSGINGFQMSTRVGTPDYMAPEIVLPHSYSYSCDYWSLGVMTYEMLAGTPPFHGATEDETFQKILVGSMDLDVLEDVSDTCKDFIAKLLIADPGKRLGANRFEEIMEHKWFEGIDWDNVRNMEPVFVPDIQDEKQNMYFLSRYEFADNAENDIKEDLKEMSEEEKAVEVKNDPEDLNVKPSQNEAAAKRSSRKRSSTHNPMSARQPLLQEVALEAENEKKNNSGIQDAAGDDDSKATPPNSPKGDESMGFEKVSLQHLKTMNEGECEKIRRKRSTTVTAVKPPSIYPDPSEDEQNPPKFAKRSNNALGQSFSIKRKSLNAIQSQKNIEIAFANSELPLGTFRNSSSSNFAAMKYKQAQNQVCSPLVQPSPIIKALPQNPHLKSNAVLHSGPTSHKKLGCETKCPISPLVSTNYLTPAYVTNKSSPLKKKEFKVSSSLTNLSTILNSSHQGYRHSDSVENFCEMTRNSNLISNQNFCSDIDENEEMFTSSMNPPEPAAAFNHRYPNGSHEIAIKSQHRFNDGQ